MESMYLGGAQMIAAARVTGATGASTMAQGCVSARSAAGVYTLTLTVGQTEYDATEGFAMACGTGATFANFVVQDTSDTVKTVRAFDAAGAALDADFSFLAFRFLP